MAGNLNTRKFPTLTEIVEPTALTPQMAPEFAPDVQILQPPSGDQVGEGGSHPLGGLLLGPDALAEAVIQQIGPSLELELRRSAHALLDVQLTALLPELHQRLEEMVRQAILANSVPKQP